MSIGEIASEMDIIKIKAVADYLLGKGAGDALLKGKEIRVVKSKSTGRIRNIYVDGVLVASIRASDGYIIPSIEGAKKLLKYMKDPKVVVVKNEVAEFIAKGRNLFVKHVVRVHPEIRAGDEVIVVDEDGNLVAVGRAVLSSIEMMRAKKGIAVKIRRGILK